MLLTVLSYNEEQNHYCTIYRLDPFTKPLFQIVTNMASCFSFSYLLSGTNFPDKWCCHRTDNLINDLHLTVSLIKDSFVYVPFWIILYIGGSFIWVFLTIFVLLFFNFVEISFATVSIDLFSIQFFSLPRQFRISM
jgi:hypothetical protein